MNSSSPHPNHCAVKILPVQPLTAAVTKGHILPFNCTHTPGTHGEAYITSSIIYNFPNRQRSSVALGTGHLLVCIPGHAPSIGHLSYCHSNTPLSCFSNRCIQEKHSPTHERRHPYAHNKKQVKINTSPLILQHHNRKTVWLHPKPDRFSIYLYQSSVIEHCSSRSFRTFLRARVSSTRTLLWERCNAAPISCVLRSRKYFPSRR